MKTIKFLIAGFMLTTLVACDQLSRLTDLAFGLDEQELLILWNNMRQNK